MKNLKINKAGLEMYDLQIVTENFRFIRLTDNEAFSISYEDLNSPFNDLVSKYGKDRLLKEGEKYVGYGLYDRGYCTVLVKMNGAVERYLSYKGMDASLRECSRNGCLFIVTDGECSGSFKYVWELAATPWSRLSSVEVEESLRKKICSAITSDCVIEVTDEEYKVLRRYLGSVTLKEFFWELSE